MNVSIIVIIVCAALFALYLVISFIVSLVIVKKAFGKRCDKNPLLKYYSAEDFNLTAQSVETKVNKTVIRGYIYTSRPLKECKTLVIFAHGMGPGQCAYTTEIAYFCKHGFAVLAFDCIGCNLSDSKGNIGLETATLTLNAAIEYAQNDSNLKDKKIALVGHSMGAYAALCVTRFKKPDCVVAMSAPYMPSSSINYLAQKSMGAAGDMLILLPFIKLINKVKHGKYGEINAAQAVEQSGVKTLIIHGEEDPVVPLNLSAYTKAQGKNITKILCNDKRHNPYNTVRAEDALSVLQDGLAKCKIMTDAERKKFFSARNYKIICEEDEKVMSTIVDFIK